MCYKSRAIGFALALMMLFQVAAPSRADDGKAPPAVKPPPAAQAPPAVQAPKVYRMTIDVSGTQTVYYNIQNGTPRLQTVYRMLAWAENEMTVVEQLQKLKIDYINNERLREAQDAYSGFTGSNRNGPNYGWESTLKTGLSKGLAREGTPQAAVIAIQMLERAETDAANELKQLTPPDRAALDATNKKMQDFVAANDPNANAAPPASAAIQ
jgi:hypothetical protein